MTDYFDQLDALGGQGGWGGTTGPTPFSGGGRALEDFFSRLGSRVQSPLVDYKAITAAKGGPSGYGYNPFNPQGRVAQVSPAFQPAQPPERYNVNLLGESISTLAESALGQGFLGTPGAQRGGVMPVNTGFGSFGLATTPVNFQNFATYAREAPLAVMTSILGHKYQQPVGGDPYAAPAGPENKDDILANISQGDWENVLDNVIDGVAQVGTTLGDAAMAIPDWFRQSNAMDRGRGVRDIFTRGETPGTWLARATSLFDGSRFNWQGILAKAQVAGWDPLDMAAELWDLNPEIVRAIAANPNMSDEQLEKLVRGEPFSYDPGVNIVVELAANIAPLVVGAGLVRGVGIGGRALGLALRPAEMVAQTSTAGRLGATAIDSFAAIRAAGLIGKPIAVAARVGSWSMPQAYRAVRMAEAANRYSLIAGTGIRLGEWGLKQAFELGGMDEMVAVMDAWLWEMPLSNNPGLMLLDAFAVHPIRTGKALTSATADRLGWRTLGGADLDVSPRMARSLGVIGDMPLEVAQERLFDRLGWDAADVTRLFGEEAPTSKTDLYNGLLYVAAQVVRARHETRLRFLEPTADVVSRNEAFWRMYGDEAVSLLQQALTGRGKDANAIVEAIKGEFWERTNLIDAAELGNEGYIGPYDGYIALLSLASWVRASTKVREYAIQGEVLKLREDVNRQPVAAYRERLAQMKPSDVVPARMLNEIRIGVPAIIKFERGALKRRGNYSPKVTVRNLLRILDAAEAEQSVADLRAARPRTTGVPALTPDVAERPLEIARAFGLRQATVDRLLAAASPEDLAAGGPVSDDLIRVLFDTHRMQPAEIRRRREVAWQHIYDWWQVRYPDAVARGQALADVDRFAKIVADRYAGASEGGLDAEAFRRIKETVTHPYRLEETKAPMAAARADAHTEALGAWLDAVKNWLDSPARTYRVVTATDGRNYVEVDGFAVADIEVINRLAGRAAALEGMSPESVAILSDPLAHPLEKVGPIREAVAEHPEFTMTDAETARLRDVGDFELVYGSAVKDVLGEDAIVTRETVEQLTLDAVAAAEEIDSLREQGRSLAQMVDRSPTKGMTGELTDFMRRAAALGSRPLGRRRAAQGEAKGIPNWRYIELSQSGLRRAATAAAVSNAQLAARARIAAAEKMLAEADAMVSRVSMLGDRGFHYEDVTWNPEPLQSFRTEKAALHAASELHRVEGTITGVRRIGPRQWKLYEGKYTPQERVPVETPPAPEVPVAAAEAPPAPEAAPVAEAATAPPTTTVAIPTDDGGFNRGYGTGPAGGLQRLSVELGADGEPVRYATREEALGTTEADALIRRVIAADEARRAEGTQAQPPEAPARSAFATYREEGAARAAEVAALDRAQLEAAVAEGRAEVERMEAAGEHFGMAGRADSEVRRLAELRAADYDTQPLPDPITAGEEVQRFTREALGNSEDLYGYPTRGAERRSAGEYFDARVKERTAEALADVAERRAHEALAQSGLHPQFIGVRSRLFVHPIKVRWQGDTPVPVSERGKTDLVNFGYRRIVNGKVVPVEQAEPRWVAISQEAINYAREYGKSNKEMGYWSKAAQKELDEAEAWLSSAEAQQLRDYVPAPAEPARLTTAAVEGMDSAQLIDVLRRSKPLDLPDIVGDSGAIRLLFGARGFRFAFDQHSKDTRLQMTAPDGKVYFASRPEGGMSWDTELDALGQWAADQRTPAPEGPPPIVERLSEGERAREAQVEAMVEREAVADEVALERRAAYEASRRLPGGAGALDELGAQVRALAPDDQAGYDALVERYGLEEVAAAENRLERAEAWPSEQVPMFGEGAYIPPALDALIAKLPPPTAEKIAELNQLIDTSIVGARDNAASSRIADRAVNAAQRELDTKTGANATERARLTKALRDAKRRASSINRAAEQMWSDRAAVLEGIKHGISTGRWDATLISAVDQLSGADLVAFIDRAIAELKPKGQLNIGDSSRWFNEHFEEIVRKATDPNEATTDPTIAFGGPSTRGQVDPALRRGVYRKAPTEALKRWLASADPKRREQISMLNEELARRGVAPGGGARATGRPVMPTEGGPAIGDAVVIDGVKHRIRRMDETVDLSVAGGHWQQKTIVKQLGSESELVWDDKADVWRVQPAGAAPAAPAIEPTIVEFRDPLDNTTPVPARVVLVDADAVLTSDEVGFPRNLQPRDRAGRESSAKQISEMAADLQPESLIGTTTGAEGMPVVMPSGAVLAGNGRIAAIRLAKPDIYDRYRAKIVTEAAKYGYTPEDVAALNRPVLVREMLPVERATAERLAWQLNRSLPQADLVAAISTAIEGADIRAFQVAEGASLRDALTSVKNADAVQRLLARLPLDWHKEFYEPGKGLSKSGVDLFEGAIIAKLLRAGDRNSVNARAAKDLVVSMVEDVDDDIRRLTAALGESAGQILKAQEDAVSGLIGSEGLTFGEDLVPALWDILGKRQAGESFGQMQVDYATPPAFAELALTPTQTHIAEVLVHSSSIGEAATFLRGVAEASRTNPAEGMALFGNQRVDYTGILNAALRKWNDRREQAGRPQLDYFASENAPYDTPLGTGVSENVLGGTEGPARMTPPLALEEVVGEVVARTEGESPLISPETVEATRRWMDANDTGPMPTDPLEAALFTALRADFDDVLDEYADIVDDFTKMSPEAQADAFKALLDSANKGDISAGEWLALRGMAGPGGIRKSRGRYNFKQVAPLPDPETVRTSLDHLRDRGPLTERQMQAAWARAWADVLLAEQHLLEMEQYKSWTPDQLARMDVLRTEIKERSAALERQGIPRPDRSARDVPPRTPAEVDEFNRSGGHLYGEVIDPQPQLPISAEEHAAIVGPDVPFDTASPTVDAAIASTAHTIVVGENPAVNRAVRRAVGAPRVDDPQRRLYEVHAPDARVMAERAEAQQQRALAALEAARRELAEVEAEAARAEGPEAPMVESVFPDDALRDMWERLMIGADIQELAAATGATEPRFLGELAEAVESIDRGLFADPVTGVGLTAAEAETLRTHLMRVMNGELEAAIGRTSASRLSHFTRNVTRAPDDFDAAALQDASKLVMDELESGIVVIDPNLPPIEGFLGAQYVLATPPKRSKVDGGALSPRLLYPDLDRLDSIVPTLKEELQVGRMEDWPRRVGNARTVRLLEHIFGPRPEKEIRAQALANFKREIGRFVDPDLTDATELARIDKVIEGAYERWLARQEDITHLGFQQYRRVSLMGPEKLNAKFMEAVDAEYTVRPTWISDMYAAGQSPAKLWRRADNRIRNYIAESGLPLSHALEKLYGKAADLGEMPGRHMTVGYHMARFLMDIRWLGLEAIEPMMIAVPRGGVGPVLEASALRKSSKVQTAARALKLIREGEPLAFGMSAQQLALREFAHWAQAGDMEQASKTRWRYLVRELAREQERPFREIVKSMMREEPGLKRIIEESDNGNVDAFLARLDRDWQLAERGTKEFASTSEAARFFKRWLDDDVIDPQTYSEFVEAKRYTQSTQIEAELAKTLNDPVMNAVWERLAAVNQSLFHDLTAVFFGQENRSNLQRAFNHPFLFWPISYQIKATKWLMKLMLDEFGGVDTGATVAGAFQSVYDEHRRRWVADPAYRKRYTDNRTLYFMAGMLFPIVPTELGVSLAPFTRLVLNSAYDRPFGIFGVGPVYTNLQLIPRLITEQAKEGGLLAEAPPEVVDKLKQLAPQTISISGRDKRPTSTIEAANREVIVPGSLPIPYQQPIDRANP